MEMEIPLARQVEAALEKLGEELCGLKAGTIVLQIRNDTVGRFGIRHLPVDCGSGIPGAGTDGLDAAQVRLLRKMAIDALRHKTGWTHGELSYDFVLKQGQIQLSMQIESNYNMANLMFRLAPKNRNRRDVSNE